MCKCNFTHKSKGSLTGGRHGPAQRAGPPGTKGLGRERWSFYVLFDYSVVVLRKVKQGVCTARGGGNTIMIVVAYARSVMSSCHLDGWWLLYVVSPHHQSSFVTRSVRFYKPNQLLCCCGQGRWTDTQRPTTADNWAQEHSSKRKDPHHCAKIASWVKN